MRAARVIALMEQREFVTPDDIKRIALPALRHRVAMSPDAMLEGRKVDDLLRTVLDTVAAATAGRASIAVVDLACGAGSTLRALTERLPKSENWRFVDNDLGLLARAAALAKPPELTVAPVAIDLARDLELALDGPVELVTTSALLDLVSHDWLERLATEDLAQAEARAGGAHGNKGWAAAEAALEMAGLLERLPAVEAGR